MKEKSPKIEDIKCPICGGAVNQMWLDSGSSSDTMAAFICECWSGDTEKGSKGHLFKVRIFDLPTIELTYED